MEGRSERNRSKNINIKSILNSVVLRSTKMSDVVGRIMTLGDAMEFWKRCAEAEKVMGPLSIEEKTVILNNFGKEISKDEMLEMLKTKRALKINIKKDSHGLSDDTHK